MFYEVLLNGKPHTYLFGGCGQAVYIFGTRDAAKSAYGRDTQDQDALLIVPADHDWRITAEAALRARAALAQSVEVARRAPAGRLAVIPSSQIEESSAA